MEETKKKKKVVSVRGVLRRVFGGSKKNHNNHNNMTKHNNNNNNKSKKNSGASSSLTNIPSLHHSLSSSSSSSSSSLQHLHPTNHQEYGTSNDDNEEKNTGKMAVFRNFLTKNRLKAPEMRVDDRSNLVEEIDEEFESKKQEWQEELDQMSEFLVLKSTEEQRQEGVESPVDTAYLDHRDGKPVLKACFDVKHFKPEEVQLSVEDGQLTLFAQCLEEKEVALYKKTMIRKMQLPKHADHTSMHCHLSPDQKVLTVEMPFELPTQKKPLGPLVVPIVSCEGGKRKIRLAFPVGGDFVEDDLRVSLDESKKCLTVEASYEASLGVEASQVTRRQFRKKFRMPDFVRVEKVQHSLSAEGQLFVDVLLHDHPPFQAHVTTEIVPMGGGAGDVESGGVVDGESSGGVVNEDGEVDGDGVVVGCSGVADEGKENEKTVDPSFLVTEL